MQLERLGIPYVVLERRAEPGGTWTINRYPDVRVDTISITYEFSFEKDYRVVGVLRAGRRGARSTSTTSRSKYGVHANTRFEHDLKEATFDEDRDVWVLEVDTPDGLETIEANAIVNAVGTFANPKYPNFEGMESFEGEILHPARWPEDFDVTGKRVGGHRQRLDRRAAARPDRRATPSRSTCSSAPRSGSARATSTASPSSPRSAGCSTTSPATGTGGATWPSPRCSARTGSSSPDDEWKAQGGTVNPMNDKLRDDLTAYIKAQTGGRQDLIDKLVPDYAPFSRRPVVDNGWYKALTRDNVELVTDRIARLTPKGIETADGTVRDVDVHRHRHRASRSLKYLWPADYIGKDGVEHPRLLVDGRRRAPT